MPSTSAARRASPASSREQQPREPVRSAAGVCDSARCTPTTSCPAATARAAATAESTPPLIAASTLIWLRTLTGSPAAAPPAGPARRPRRSPRPRASTSSGVEVWPSEKRSDPRADASSAPIASSTWLGWATPAVQAEPVEHSMPCASSSISRLSPSQPGKDRCALPGSRDGPPSIVPVPGSPLSRASGTVASTLPTRSSRSPASIAARRGASATAISTAVASATIAGVSSVPERTSRSWPAAVQQRRERAPRAAAAARPPRRARRACGRSG